MKILLAIPILFCLQTASVDTIRTDTLKPVKLFFETEIEQRADELNYKLDSLLIILQAKNDTLKLKL